MVDVPEATLFLPVSTAFIHQYLRRCGWKFVPSSHLYARIWSPLILHSSCTCAHNCCEFTCGAAMLCPEDTVSLETATTSGSYALSTLLFHTYLWALIGRECNTNVPFTAEIFLTVLFSEPRPVVDLRANHHLLHKYLLWWGLRDALLCVYNSTSLKISLILCPFKRVIVGISP